ncbi:MAG: YwbE family protein [Candidatus Heimdallarchaeota archaeon]|nr:YwbE family protein [Candidatus Heimdallarchaeota archaeon]
MNPSNRKNIKLGQKVQVVEKQNQKNGKLTEGIVAKILTNSANHPHGIKVKLESGKVGRVKIIESE